MNIFWRCPMCDSEKPCEHLRQHGRQVDLLPCTFCEGPPVPFATSQRAGFVFQADGSMVDAYVFCHECGAHGPRVDGLCYDEDDAKAFIDQAVLLWQTRNARHRSLFDSGTERRLNQHPRDDDPAWQRGDL